MIRNIIKQMRVKLSDFRNKQVLIDRVDLKRLLDYIEQLEEIQL